MPAGASANVTANELDSAGEARLYQTFRHFWHPVAYAADVNEAPVPATLLDEQLVLVRLGGEVRCFRDLCVHRGTALSLGWVRRGVYDDPCPLRIEHPQPRQAHPIQL